MFKLSIVKKFLLKSALPVSPLFLPGSFLHGLEWFIVIIGVGLTEITRRSGLEGPPTEKAFSTLM